MNYVKEIIHSADTNRNCNWHPGNFSTNSAAAYAYAFDQIQAAYMTFLGLDALNLLASIDANETLIEEAGLIQHSYTAPGGNHTIINNEEFYTMTVNGIALVDWVEALILGKPLDDVHCDECG